MAQCDECHSCENLAEAPTEDSLTGSQTFHTSFYMVQVSTMYLAGNENMRPHRKLCMNIHGSIIHKRQSESNPNFYHLKKKKWSTHKIIIIQPSKGMAAHLPSKAHYQLIHTNQENLKSIS